MKIKSFVFAALFTSNAFALTVYWDLSSRRMKNFANWTVVALLADHCGWPPVQPASRWTNLTFTIPDYAEAIQITSADASGNVTCRSKVTDGVCTARVPSWAVDELAGEFEPSIERWGPPMNVSVGFLISQVR